MSPLRLILFFISLFFYPLWFKSSSIASSKLTLEQKLQTNLTQNINKKINPSVKKTQNNLKIRSTQAIHASKSRITIVIDPGHGGKDSGTVNPTFNLKEKTVTLSIAKKLKYHLEKTSNFRIILTRSNDHFLPLRQRVNIARRYQPDLLISIHSDAFIHPHAQGASVFALSLKGASSEAAKWLAEKENHSELGGAQIQSKDTLLRSVLINLSQTMTISESLRAGETILHELGKITQLHQGVVEKANFIVLKAPDVPALLIETGFLSNKKEAAKLSNDQYRNQIAKSIAKGITNYFKHHYKNRPTASL